MNDAAAHLKTRTKTFALDVLAFLRTLPKTQEASDICRQLLRSATGTAANYRSACRSRSHSEFVARIGVALEEADESSFWLEILIEGHLATASTAERLLEEAAQLTAILAQSKLTAQRNASVRQAAAARTRRGSSEVQTTGLADAEAASHSSLFTLKSEL
jgi:four helix bundle protein